MRAQLTRARGISETEKEMLKNPDMIIPTYSITARIPPTVRVLSGREMRKAPAQRITTVARLSKNMQTGLMSPARTLARMMLSAITRVAASVFFCSVSSRLKARTTRIPVSRLRTSAFCLSMYSSEIFQSG